MCITSFTEEEVRQMGQENKTSGIEVGRTLDKGPPVLCPHCKKVLHLVIDGFKPDITKIVRSECTHCKGEIYACLLILTDITMAGVVSSAQSITALFAEEQRKLNKPIIT
jgi:hypothetical protein